MTANGGAGPACREVRQLLGVYVVGAIDPAERAVVDDHLASCRDCREELSGLAGLPALLRRVPLADAERLAEGGYGVPDMAEPPAELLNSLLRRVTARRRNRRWRAALTLAAAVAIAAGGTAAVMEAQQPPAQIATSDVAHGSNALVTAMVSYTPTSWGTAMRVAVSGVPAGTACKFWVIDASGHRHPAGAWTTGPGYGEHWYSASSPVPESKVHSFQITAHGKTLVNIPAS
ncbi:MAG TPA: zf-HC2 domain-containing protein [Streptosporangiaceae bacterium]|jgi:anti-sigma-K factor RskA